MGLLANLGKTLLKGAEIAVELAGTPQPLLGTTYTSVERVGRQIHYAGCKMYPARRHTWKRGRRVAAWSDATHDTRIGTVVGWVVLDQVVDGVLRDVNYFVLADKPADALRVLKSGNKP